MTRLLLFTICWVSTCAASSTASAAGADAGVAAAANLVTPLQLRIVADADKHAALIDAARAQQARESAANRRWSEVVLDPADAKKPIGRWVKTSTTTKSTAEFAGEQYTKRKRHDPAGTSTSLEVLVVLGPWDITTDHVAEASAGRSSFGKPAVLFTLTEEGAERFEKLTGENLPAEDRLKVFQLGIIFNNVLISAPRINSKIGRQGEINGTFTEEETEKMAAILNSKRLPAGQK